MSTTRTDIHRPSAPDFDPTDYTCIGVFYLGSNPNVLALIPGASFSRSLHADAVERLEAQGKTRGGVYGSRQCSHCGASRPTKAEIL